MALLSRLPLVVSLFAVGCGLLPSEDSPPPPPAIVVDTGSIALDSTSVDDDASDASVDVELDAEADVDTLVDATDAAPKCPAAPTGMLPRAVWAWQTATFTDAATKASFFDFAASHAVTTVYLQVGPSHMPDGGADASPLGRFIAEADARCIAVELLVGDARWTLTQFHPTVVAIATAAKSFTTALTGAKPKAFHVDIEPHGVKDVVSDGVSYNWATTGQRPAIMNQFLDVLGKLKAALGTTLPLHADIAFWLNPLQRMSGGMPVGSPRPAHELVIDAVDRVQLMSYRDTAFGPSCAMPSCSAEGIYDLSRTEVLYAGKVGKRAIVGVETGDYGDKLSFFEEDVATMEIELGKVVTAYGSEPGLGGVAVHHLVAYRALQAKTP